MNLKKLKMYLTKMGEISRLPHELKSIRLLDSELAEQIEYVLNLPNYVYDNEVVRITMNDNGCVAYTNMASLTFDKTLEEYIDKCIKLANIPKKHLVIGG